jgi:hypothetical protein
LIITWFFLLYNVERPVDMINIASFVYGFAFIIAVAVIAIPALHEWPFSQVVILLLPPYFLLKIYFGYPLDWAHLPIVVTEIATLVLTLLLARQIMERFTHLQEGVARVTLSHLEETSSFDDGQSQIYREIRRARRRQRPLALLAIKPTAQSVSFSLDRFLEEAKAEIIHHYIHASVANLLLTALEDYDIVTRRNDHFIVVLPETEEDELAETIDRLQREARNRLGIEFNIGKARFPDDAVTFGQLLTDAERAMNHPSSGGLDIESRTAAESAAHQVTSS